MSGKKSASVNRRILYDGWPLAYEPNGAAALHLLELIDVLPDSFEAWLALPRHVDLPEACRAQVSILPHGAQDNARFRWEQVSIPRLARRVNAGLIHSTSLHLPLWSPVACLTSPVELLPRDSSAPEGLPARLRNALGRGGLAGARAVLWPNDLPDPPLPARVQLWRLPPAVHPAFFQLQPDRLHLPEPYVLVPDLLTEEAQDLLAAAWSWTAAGLEDGWTLLVSGLQPAPLERLRQQCQDGFGFNRVERIEFDRPEQRAMVFQHAAAVLCVGDVSPWGDVLLQALACACPLAAPQSPLVDQRVGPAGFLVPPGDARALGAAALTLLVEEPLAQELRRQAKMRADGWRCEEMGTRLAEVYEAAMAGPISGPAGK